MIRLINSCACPISGPPRVDHGNACIPPARGMRTNPVKPNAPLASMACGTSRAEPVIEHFGGIITRQASLRGAFAFISESMAAWAITAAIRGSVAATAKTWPPLSDEPQSPPGRNMIRTFRPNFVESKVIRMADTTVVRRSGEGARASSAQVWTTSPSCSPPATEGAERGQAVLPHGSTTSRVEIARRPSEGSEHDRVSRDKRGRF